MTCVARKLLTLTLVQRENEVLLGFKKRGFGQGKWNGFGGKVEPGETIVNAAVRELQEESSLVVLPCDLTKSGTIDFEFQGDPTILEVHIFTTSKFTGTPTETEEMNPKWYTWETIPFHEMWADDRLWFPFIQSGFKFKGYFLFQGHDTILEQKLDQVESLEDV